MSSVVALLGLAAVAVAVGAERHRRAHAALRARIGSYAPGSPSLSLAAVLRRVGELERGAIDAGDTWAVGEVYGLALTLADDARKGRRDV